MSAPQTKDGLETIGAEPEDYRFTFEAHPTRVTIVFDGVTVADSSNVRVMQETRLAPVYYFPRDDLNWDLLQPSKHRTYCPFKGNASYWSLVVSGRRTENAAWSYEDPFEEATHIKGYVAFYAELVDVIDEGEKPIDDEADASLQIHTNPLLGWLLNDAPLITSSKELTESFARALQTVGIPIWRMSVIIRTLHPQVMAESLRWWA